MAVIVATPRRFISRRPDLTPRPRGGAVLEGWNFVTPEGLSPPTWGCQWPLKNAHFWPSKSAHSGESPRGGSVGAQEASARSFPPSLGRDGRHRGPQSPLERTSPRRMGSRPSETGADPGAAAAELEDGARRGGPFRLE